MVIGVPCVASGWQEIAVVAGMSGTLADPEAEDIAHMVGVNVTADRVGKLDCQGK